MSVTTSMGMNPYTAFGSGRGGDFPSPWLDMATQAMPEQNKNALEWCEYIFQANGTYRMAQERIISYFLTDLDIASADKRKPLGDDEKEQWTNILSETLSITEAIQSLDRDEACYGNGFMTLVVPFKRFLISPFAPIEFEFSKMVDSPGVFNLQYDASKNEFVKMSSSGFSCPSMMPCFSARKTSGSATAAADASTVRYVEFSAISSPPPNSKK